MQSQAITNVSLSPAGEPGQACQTIRRGQRVCGQKRPIIPPAQAQSFKCPGCMCGTELCKRLRRVFKERDDPLMRYTYHKIKFPSDKKKNWQQKVRKRKGIYEEAMNKSFDNDKDYYLATLHFPVKVLAFCQKSNKSNPTLAFKQSEWAEMKEFGDLGQYLPPRTNEYQTLEYGGQPICFLPPCVQIQEVEYSLEAEKALESMLGNPKSDPRKQKTRRTGDNSGSSSNSSSTSTSSVASAASIAPIALHDVISGQKRGDTVGQQAICSFCESALANVGSLPELPDQLPDEIRSGVQSSLSLCLRSEDGCIPTEVGSWVKGFKQTNSRADPLRGIQKLADHACRGESLEEYFHRAMSLGGPPQESITVTFNNCGLERGENWKQVAVLYKDTCGNDLTVWENVFLVKSENPTQAYKSTVQAKKFIEDYGPKSGTIEYAMILPSVRSIDDATSSGSGGPVKFRHPSRDVAQYVSIKKINKERVRHYQQDEGGTECPYREISLLREVGDDRHVHKLIEALEDDDYLYIITEYSGNQRSLRDDKHYSDETGIQKSDQELKDLFVNILEIVEYLDRYNLYHSALTPEYLEIHNNRVLLTRIGLATKIPREKHRSGPFKVPLGPLDTLSFRAPEVHNQNSIVRSSSSNLWSAAITLYFVVTGRTPYSIPHPSDAGFRMYMSLGSLEEMTIYLNRAAVINGMHASVIQHGCPSPHIMKLLSHLLKWEPSQRCSPQQAVNAARHWCWR